MESEILSALERIAVAVERLGADPEIEIEFGQPICPHCGKFNPEIKVAAQEESRGPMLEFLTPATCGNCEKSIFIAPESFSVHRELETLRREVEARKAGFSQ